MTWGSLRSRLIASKLGFEPVETKENQFCLRPLTDFAPMTAIPKAQGGSRSTGCLSPVIVPGREPARPGRRLAEARKAWLKRPPIGLRRFSFACNPLKNLNRRKEKFQNISGAPATPGDACLISQVLDL